MDVSLISIGNSKGIRLSKTILEKYNIQHGNIIEMLPWELNWQEHTSDSFNNELLLYRVTSDELKNILYTWLMQKKPN